MTEAELASKFEGSIEYELVEQKRKIFPKRRKLWVKVQGLYGKIRRRPS